MSRRSRISSGHRLNTNVAREELSARAVCAAITPDRGCHMLSTPAMVAFPLSLAVAMAAASPARADAQQDKISALATSIAAQQEKLNQEELQLEQQALELHRQQQLIDAEMASLRGAGTGGTKKAKGSSNAAASTSTPAYTSTPEPQYAQAQPQTAGAEQQQVQEENRDQRTKVILQSSTTLSNTGGVLTPKGQLLIDPSIEYDYWTQNQLNLNGFTIVPGITFGNIFISRVDQRFLTEAVTARYGVTDNLEINLKIPVVESFGSLTSQQAGTNAVPLSVSQSNANIGDIQFGSSYQFNSGENGWPVFVGNVLFKTATGQDPYDVPIYNADNTNPNDQTNQLLWGVPKKLPTGTGFYSLQPSVTVFYATAPGVLFGNVQFIQNFARTFNIPNPGGGATREQLLPGKAVEATFGIGFALNDKASMTFSYEEEHVFSSSSGGQQIPGSNYDFGTFNFGMGYAISSRTNVNIGVGIGVGPYAPAAKILLEVPTRFNLL